MFAAAIIVACFKIHLPINPISPIILSRTINKNKSIILWNMMEFWIANSMVPAEPPPIKVNKIFPNDSIEIIIF